MREAEKNLKALEDAGIVARPPREARPIPRKHKPESNLRETIKISTFLALQKHYSNEEEQKRGLDVEAIQQAFRRESTIQGSAVRIASYVPERRFINEVADKALSDGNLDEEILKQLSLIRHLTSDDVIDNIVEFVNAENDRGQLMLSIYLNHHLVESDARCIAGQLS